MGLRHAGTRGGGKEMSSEEVKGKREAAMRWANHMSADESVATTWRYLLVSEDDISTAKGSWRLEAAGDVAHSSNSK